MKRKPFPIFKFFKFGLSTLTALALSACVTINIYFPAAAAEKVADKIIDEVWQMPADNKGAKAPRATPEKEQK